MTMQQGLMTGLWLAGTTAAGAVSVATLSVAESGKLSAFALVPLLWSVALGAGFVHQVRQSYAFSALPRRRAEGAVPLAPAGRAI